MQHLQETPPQVECSPGITHRNAQPYLWYMQNTRSGTPPDSHRAGSNAGGEMFQWWCGGRPGVVQEVAVWYCSRIAGGRRIPRWPKIAEKYGGPTNEWNGNPDALVNRKIPVPQV